MFPYFKIYIIYISRLNFSSIGMSIVVNVGGYGFECAKTRYHSIYWLGGETISNSKYCAKKSKHDQNLFFK